MNCFKTIANNSVKVILAFLINRGTKTPSVAPCKDGVKILLLLFISSFETLFFLKEYFEEVANTSDELQVICCDWFGVCGSNLINCNINSCFESIPEELFQYWG